MNKIEKMDKIDEYFDKALITKKGTMGVFRSHISKYFKVIDKDIDTYFKQKQPYEEQIRTYWKYLQGKAPKTRQVAISSIKGFLRRFDKKGTKDLDIWDDIAARTKGNNEPVSEKHVPDIDELKQILHYCDIRTKTTIMIALSSGMRISEVCQLLPDDINLNEKPVRINIRAEIAKNGKRRTTFITPETTELLNEWKRIRDDYIERSLASMNFKDMQFLKDRKDRRIFPYHTNSIRTSFNKACDKAGFTGATEMKGDFDLSADYKKEHKYKRQRRKLTYHNLRSFFRTYFGNVDLAEHLMGHTGYLSTYRQYNDKQLAKEYLKQMHNVFVFEVSSDEKIKDMDTRMQEKDKEIQELKQEMNNVRMELLEIKFKQAQALQRRERNK